MLGGAAPAAAGACCAAGEAATPGEAAAAGDATGEAAAAGDAAAAGAVVGLGAAAGAVVGAGAAAGWQAASSDPPTAALVAITPRNSTRRDSRNASQTCRSSAMLPLTTVSSPS